MPQLKEMIKELERFAPLYLAESWDNVGLMIGNPNQTVHKVLCALDASEEVIDEAIENQVDCIITHHPLLFKPLKFIHLETKEGRMIEKIIQNHMSVYSMHTNYDITWGGINDVLAQGLKLEKISILETTYEEPLYKCIIYVPKTHIDCVRETIVKHMTTQIGQYLGCTFTTSVGEGTFIPLEGSHPYLGEPNRLEQVDECQIGFMSTKLEIEMILEIVKTIHPYEEMAVDVIELKNHKKTYGIGRYGILKEPVSLNKWIDTIKQYFKCSVVRATDITDRTIQKVAICSGAGSSFIKKAASVADVYITGDLKFHEGQLAKSLGLTVIDVGHYMSEAIALSPIIERIQSKFSDCKVIESKVNGETLFIR